MWLKVVVVWLVVVLSGQLPEAIADSVLTEASEVTEGPVLSPAPDSNGPFTLGAPHAAGEEDRPEEECDEDDDFHPPSNRCTTLCSLARSTGNTPSVAFALHAGHTTLWPLPPDAN